MLRLLLHHGHLAIDGDHILQVQDRTERLKFPHRGAWVALASFWR